MSSFFEKHWEGLVIGFTIGTVGTVLLVFSTPPARAAFWDLAGWPEENTFGGIAFVVASALFFAFLVWALVNYVPRRDDERLRPAYHAPLWTALLLLLFACVLALTATVSWGVDATAYKDRADTVQYFQSLATMAALLAGAAWALYVFIVSRSHAAFANIQFEPVLFGEHEDGKSYAVVSFSIRNSGRVALWKGGIEVTAAFPERESSQDGRDGRILEARSVFERVRLELDEDLNLIRRPYYDSTSQTLLIYENDLMRFEPGQEVHVALTLYLENNPLAVVKASLTCQARSVLPQRRNEGFGKERFHTKRIFEAATIVDPFAVPPEPRG